MTVARQGIDFFMSERLSLYTNVAAVIGSLVLAKVSLRFLCGVYRWTRAYFLAPLGIGRTNLKKYGSWAVVTGASEGIGRGYALELARQGLNVVIMSRSQEKLDKVAVEIRDKYGCEVRVVVADFSQGAEICPQIEESLQDLDIGVLVNNVGVRMECPGVFLNMSIERMRRMIEVNIQSMVHTTHVIMPRMVAKGCGIVINLSSARAVRPGVMMNLYASTKAFIDFFSQCLSHEYSSKGIIVQNVAPFFVATGTRRASWMVADLVQFTRSAVATIGILSYTHGCLFHAIQGILFRRVPDFMYIMSSWSTLQSTRARYLKNQAKQK